MVIPMIEDNIQIQVDASPEKVFELIESMPNKFHINSFMETKPILFLRLMLVDGIESARKGMQVDRDIEELRLETGESMGPFTLTIKEKPSVYFFDLKSLFFNCRTGYQLAGQGNSTRLDFVLIADSPCFRERVWWFFVKPIHRLFAAKVLRVIKEKVEEI